MSDEEFLNDLEKEFAAVYKEHQAEIEAKLQEARKNLKEAVDISNKYGIPFNGGISFLRNSYFPPSYFTNFEEKVVQVDEEDNFYDRDSFSEFVSDITGAWQNYDKGYPGWSHSAVC